MKQHKNYLHLYGGVDINPIIYNQQAIPETQQPNNVRDVEEIAAVNDYMFRGLPIIGVCRGAQLLCALNGGELYQHAMGHGHAHDLMTKNGVVHNAAAGHHQIMKLDNCKEEHEIIAWTPYKTRVVDYDTQDVILIENSAEIVWFPKTKCLAIQPHPEWEPKGSEFLNYINGLVKELTGLDDIFNN